MSKIGEMGMNPIAEILLEQVAYAQRLAQQILSMSEVNDEGVLYAFATPDMLVINCSDYETIWRLDEQQSKLREAIAYLRSSIQTIVIEKAGKMFYCW
jgi:hypothetical protein